MQNNHTNITKIIETSESKFDFEIDELAKLFKMENRVQNADILSVKREEKKSIGIEEVKVINEWIFKRPYFYEYKLAIIKNAEAMTPEAQNSLLKIIEEPPQYAHIFLLTNNHRLLLQTILSRSLVIRKKESLNDEMKEEARLFLESKTLERFFQIDRLLKDNDAIKLSTFIDKLIEMLQKQGSLELIENLIESKKALNMNVNKKLIFDKIAIDLR